MADKFSILREIGSGSYGSCYLAMKNECGTEVVIKKLIKKRRAIFETLEHDFIVAFHDHFEDQHLNIVMHYASGGNLSALVKNGGIEDKPIRDYFYQLATALDYLHGKRILHRDLTSDNVYLNDLQTSVLLGDFGSAIDMRFATEDQLTNDNRGTREYSAPEMISGIVAVNEKCDMWSLGCVLYEMLERRLPFPFNCPFSKIENWQYNKLRNDAHGLEIYVTNLLIERQFRWKAKGSSEFAKGDIDSRKQYDDEHLLELLEKPERKIQIGLAEMLKGGVIMDVMNVEQAKIAQKAGAVAVMALERIPALIRKDGGVARMSDPQMIAAIQKAVTIPVMAKCRIGHFVEAQILESLQVDYIDESEVLTVADDKNHIWKHDFKVPFVCGARNLGEALRRIAEGASMIRTKGDAGSGNIVEAVRHVREIQNSIRCLTQASDKELATFGKDNRVPLALVQETAKLGHLPVPNFAAGGVSTPADAALLLQLGAEAVFVGSGIFLSDNPSQRAEAIVQAVTHYKDAAVLANVSKGLGSAMKGIDPSRETVTLGKN